MRADRAPDLHLVRELTERQADQLVADRERAENLARANHPLRVAPGDLAGFEWLGVKP